MSLAQAITRAKGGTWAGGQGLIPAPGHSAKDRGLAVRDNPNDPSDVILFAHNEAAGGDWRAIKDQWRDEGLLPPRERQALPRQNDAPTVLRAERGRDAGAWEYTDADGTVIYRKVRMTLPNGGKSYRFEHPDGRGGWLPKRGDARPAPYRLHELAHAPKSETLYMAEGEKQADKLAAWGFLATSSKDWRSFDFSGYVAGRSVVILPDNDDQGATIAAEALAAVDRAGGRAVTLTLPGLPAKGDVMDWTGTADELRALADAALNPPAETFELADLALWARVPPSPKAFVMAPYIPRNDVIVVTGDGGTNKSTLALQISACAAAGKQLLGMDVEAGPALYVTAEDDDRENHWRLAKIAAAIGTTLDHLIGKLHVASLRGRLNNELATFDSDGKLRTAPAYALLRATIEQTGAKLVTLDNVAHLFAGNENDRGQVTAFINLLYQLCGDLGVTILLIAHRNKSGDTYSGSTAWLNAVRSQILLERTDEDPDVRRLTLGKANYARQGEEMLFRWHDFALVRDSDLPADQMAEVAAVAVNNADNTRFLACLAERNRQSRQVSERPTAANYAPKQFEGMPQAKGLNKARLAAAMDRLYRIGAIERGFLYRDTSEGKDILGLREVPGIKPETSPETSRKQQPEGAGNPQETTGNTPLYPAGISGAAPAAAPFPEKANGHASRGLSRVVFPADDDDSDPAADAFLRGDQ